MNPVAPVALTLLCLAGTLVAAPKPEVVLALPPSPENPRNSEGSFIRLNDGRWLFVYTRFEGGARDNSSACLAGRFSIDGGRTWAGRDVVVLPNEARENVMSVSLLRMRDGRIALLYLRKNSWTDCRPYLRFSADETRTWSEPVEVISEARMGYYVVNNDRLVQLTNGRLVIPVAKHNDPRQNKFSGHGTISCFLSDDAGRTWHQSQAPQSGLQADGKRTLLQEPGVVELSDRRLLLFCRTGAGSQFLAHSTDAGETWSGLKASRLLSPVSPASIKRIPATGHLLIAWNNHADIAPELKGRRTPFTLAISKDDGRSWVGAKNVFDHPDGWYCYTAIEFAGEHVLLGHCAGNRKENNGLALTQITRVPLAWIAVE